MYRFETAAAFNPGFRVPSFEILKREHPTITTIRSFPGVEQIYKQYPAAQKLLPQLAEVDSATALHSGRCAAVMNKVIDELAISQIPTVRGLALEERVNGQVTMIDALEMKGRALVHDVGKQKVPLHVLRFTGKLDELSEEERGKLAAHDDWGKEMVYPYDVFGGVLIGDHHSQKRGVRYIQQGSQPLDFRLKLLQMVDVTDALAEERSYKPAWPEKSVRKKLKKEFSTYPALADAVVTARFSLFPN